jgi:hypothetical protein
MIARSRVLKIKTLLSERSRIAADLANVEKRIRDLDDLGAQRGTARERAELARAQYREEHRRLTSRLTLLDASLTELHTK